MSVVIRLDLLIRILGMCACGVCVCAYSVYVHVCACMYHVCVHVCVYIYLHFSPLETSTTFALVISKTSHPYKQHTAPGINVLTTP